jgi:ATP-dependent DNA helicase RecQ
MLAFAEATHCRRQILLRYFNETYDKPCGYCDVCDNPPDIVDATTESQKLLSCIYRLRQNYGLNHVIDVLRGSTSEKIKQFGHQHVTTYSIGKDKTAGYWKQLAWQLIHRDYCFQDAEHFNVLKLTAKAIPLLRGEETISLPVPREELSSKKTKKDRHYEPPTTNSPIFETLRNLRKKLANEENKPPFMIFSDATLHEMARIQPQNLDQMLGVSGVGQHKLTHYGQYFLDALQQNE